MQQYKKAIHGDLSVFHVNPLDKLQGRPGLNGCMAHDTSNHKEKRRAQQGHVSI